MDIPLFSYRSILTMLHGLGSGGGALLTLFAALFALWTMRTHGAIDPVGERRSRNLTWLLVLSAVLLWGAVLGGTYLVFPPYRATPPEGLTDLTAYPRSLIQSNPETAWLHSFAMEIKEHVPWIAAMLATAVAFVGVRYKSLLLRDHSINRMATIAVTICLVLAASAAVLGVFVNKVAPLE
jgi:protein-S-isoprenylcysteine O-methyltransferase Ste14